MNIFDKFKKQYHLVNKSFDKITAGEICFKLAYDKEKGLMSSITLPPEAEVSLFATCVRPFADPSSELHLTKIAHEVVSNPFYKIDEEGKKQIFVAIERVEKGPFGLNLNNESLSALDFYLIYSQGDFFDEKSKEKKKCSEIQNTPVFNKLMLYQFYDYSIEIYRISKCLYYHVRKLETFSGQPPQPANRIHNKCIYCLSTEGNFSSEEHVYPESLGNNELLLPKGVVCDKCNNEVLSGLDNHLVNHDIFSMLRVMFLPYNTKSCEFPKAVFQNMKIKKVAPRKIVFDVHNSSKSNKGFNTESVENGVNIKISTVGRIPFDPTELGRALFKISLGVICWHNGIDEALKNKYDLARDFILGKQLFPNFMLMSQSSQVINQIEGSHVFGNPGTFCKVNIFGVIFLYNLESLPIVMLTEEFKRLDFTCYSLAEKPQINRRNKGGK